MLHFECRGEWYVVDGDGNMTQERNSEPAEFSGRWKFLGVSYHYLRRGIDLRFKEALEEPRSLIGGLVWDLDHGTTRTWGGCYDGKLPRITNAYKIIDHNVEGALQ